MLDDLKKLFSQTWNAFVAEAGKRDPEDEVAELLGAMRREMVEVRAQLPLLEEHHRAAIASLEREKKAMADTERRGAMAQRIGDAETARVAAEFAEKHRRRIVVLEEKVRATKSEWELRKEEAGEMMVQYKEADANRFALVGEMRRQGARSRINSAMGGSPLHDDFSRAEEKIEQSAAYTGALEDLDAELGGGPRRSARPEPEDVDARLEELKRRMGM